MLFCLLFQVQGGMRYEPHETNNPNSRARHPSALVAVMGLGAPYGSGDSKSTNEINQEKILPIFIPIVFLAKTKNSLTSRITKGFAMGVTKLFSKQPKDLGTNKMPL